MALNGKRVYIAGPYTLGDVAQNVRNVILAAGELMDAGHVPFVPHLSHFWHLVAPRPYEDWMDRDLVWLEFCEAVIRLPGESGGADREVLRADALGIPVFASVREFLGRADDGD